MNSHSTAALVAIGLAESDSNTENARTWRQRANAAHAFNLQLIEKMGDRTLFIVRVPGVPFLRKRIPWSWLLRPMSWAFDAAADAAAPVEEREVAP